MTCQYWHVMSVFQLPICLLPSVSCHFVYVIVMFSPCFVYPSMPVEESVSMWACRPSATCYSVKQLWKRCGEDLSLIKTTRLEQRVFSIPSLKDLLGEEGDSEKESDSGISVEKTMELNDTNTLKSFTSFIKVWCQIQNFIWMDVLYLKSHHPSIHWHTDRTLDGWHDIFD